MSFYEGFEKRAYDYAHEVDVAHDYAKSRHGDQPIGWGKALGVGGLGGAGLGALSGIIGGAKGQRVMGGLKGALTGSALGALTGALIGMADRADIEEQKNIMSMDEDKRGKYLASKARDKEFVDRENRKQLGRYYRSESDYPWSHTY